MNWRRNTLPRLSGLKITYFAAKTKNQIKSIEYTSAYINDSFQRSREFKCYKVKENTEYEKQVDNSPQLAIWLPAAAFSFSLSKRMVDK